MAIGNVNVPGVTGPEFETLKQRMEPVKLTLNENGTGYVGAADWITELTNGTTITAVVSEKIRASSGSLSININEFGDYKIVRRYSCNNSTFITVGNDSEWTYSDYIFNFIEMNIPFTVTFIDGLWVTHSNEKPLAADLSGIVGTRNGGTGISYWEVNRLVYPSDPETLNQMELPAISESFLRQDTSGAPYWKSPEDVRTELMNPIDGQGMHIDNIYKTGLYSAFNDRITGLPSYDIYYVAVIDSHIQVAYSCNLTPICSRRRFLTIGTVDYDEWEWANPPMVSGVEYRTTERHNGKVVYTKLMDLGLAANGKQTALSGITVIRDAGRLGSQAIPYEYTSTGNYSYRNITPSAITLFCSSAFSNSTWYHQIWYTKN